MPTTNLDIYEFLSVLGYQVKTKKKKIKTKNNNVKDILQGYYTT